MPAKAARKRQLKFITGAMRKVDIEPIQEQLDKIKAKSAYPAKFRLKIIILPFHLLRSLLTLLDNETISVKT
jgi:ribosomal 50S subunit-associated protein YjgA (DUF615 family)